MPRSPRRCRLLAPSIAVLPLALAAALAGREARASAFQLKENSVQGLGRAFAGSATAPGDCSVVVNNPAAMGDIGEATNCFQSDLNIINFSTRFHGSGTDALGRPLSGGSGGDGGVTAPVPAMYFTHKFDERWTAGVAFSAPFGFETRYDNRSVLRYEGVRSKLQSLDLTLSASYRLTEQFSLGASFIVQRTSALLTQDIDFGTIIGLPGGGILLPQEADGYGGLHGHDWGYGYQLSALWKPTDGDRLGLVYHSQIDHRLSGTAYFQVPSNLQPLLGGAFTRTPGNAEFDTPWFATASWWHTVNDRLSLGVDVSYTHWSSFKTLAINYRNPAQAPFNSAQIFDWDNSWFYSIGGDYKLSDRWTLRAGLAYDKTPTKDATRTPRVPDGSRTWLSVGLGYKYSERLRFEGGFVHLWVKDGRIDHDTATFSTLTGYNENSGNVLGLSAQYSF